AGGLRVFPLAASTPEALKAAVAGLGRWAADHPGADPDRVAATLRRGRRELSERTVLVAGDTADLARTAAEHSGKGASAGRAEAVAFLFPGQGAQHVGMGRALYAAEPVFREALGLCAELLRP